MQCRWQMADYQLLIAQSSMIADSSMITNRLQLLGVCEGLNAYDLYECLNASWGV